MHLDILGRGDRSAANRSPILRGEVFMRGAASIFLLAGLHLGGPIAAAEPPDVPPGLGQLVVIDPQTRLPVRLNLARCHINVVLHPPVALVQIDQSFYNPYPRQLDGTFAFNLPDGGSVSRFAIYTAPGQVVEGEVVERSRVANIAQSNGDPLGDQATADQLGHNL